MWQYNIDKTYVINLPERKDRLEQVTKEMNDQNIKFEIWPATKNKNGALGLIETMAEIFEMAEKEKLKAIAVFEDDVKFVVPNVNEIMDKCMEQIKPLYWDIFYFGGNLWKPPHEFVSENVISVLYMYALHACLYSESGIKSMNQILQDILAGRLLFVPIDVAVQKFIEPNGNCYATFPLLATQHSGYSDIEKKNVNYHKFIEQRYQQVKA